MSHVMGVTQEIGIVIDLSKGTFNNTVYKNGNLQLIEVGVDSNGNTVYADSGWWESENILIQDKIQSFKNVVKTSVTTGGATCKIYTKTSDDGFIWTDYVEVNPDFTVNSPVAKFAKIKIEIFAGKINSNFYVDKFEDPLKYNNEYVNSDNGVLELKKTYSYQMNRDENFTEEGFIFRRFIEKSKFKKIDRINVIS